MGITNARSGDNRISMVQEMEGRVMLVSGWAVCELVLAGGVGWWL